MLRARASNDREIEQIDGQQRLPTVLPTLGLLPARSPWWLRWPGYYLRGMQERQRASEKKASSFHSLGRR